MPRGRGRRVRASGRGPLSSIGVIHAIAFPDTPTTGQHAAAAAAFEAEYDARPARGCDNRASNPGDRMKPIVLIVAVSAAAFCLGACAGTPEPSAAEAHVAASSTRVPAVPAHVSGTPAATRATLPKVLVHKSPTCGCCTGWVEHLRRHGFAVDVRETGALEPIRKRLGVPAGKGSCHTAEVGGLVIEGHVPAGDIKRLLASPVDARGLVLPGMPMGSPGMEMPDGREQRYTVEKVNADGSTTPFATHGN